MKKHNIEKIAPLDIEKRSFEIISNELEAMGIELNSQNELVIKRCIHTSADFDYVNNLAFSEDAVKKGIEALTKKGAVIVTDTNMGKSGINKKVLAKLNSEVICYMADEEVAEIARQNGTTRAIASMDKAAELDRPIIFAIGNAPTALVRLYELINEGKFKPELIIGVPVGFVNVVEAKELIMDTDIPYIIAKGRKGGSNIAAAICNALLYMISEERYW
ncbi:MAG: precorrin-8X methylmutase [Clostridium sp.]|nr:precorrin-8X methylmutase [Clostridium sp.]